MRERQFDQVEIIAITTTMGNPAVASHWILRHTMKTWSETLTTHSLAAIETLQASSLPVLTVGPLETSRTLTLPVLSTAFETTM